MMTKTLVRTVNDRKRTVCLPFSFLFSWGVPESRKLLDIIVNGRIILELMAGKFSLHHRVQNGSDAHLVSYPMGTSGSVPGVKLSGREADHSLPSSVEVKECVELYHHSPSTPSWRGAQLKHRDNFTREIRCEVVDWILLAHDKVEWRALVITLMNYRVP
jgi:hypothetical protein